jgi:4-diphosphocytidyl-2-C-methyl-D-erythritol kinase
VVVDHRFAPVSSSLATRAPAKINLTLHVLGRRADGYHRLESLVAFARTGDTLRLEPGPTLALTVEGPTASHAGKEADNLVVKAARQLSERVPNLRLGRFHLEKRLPVAAGIGGGSSDAAAALRLLARLNGLPPSHPALREAAAATGADVPVCLEPRARMMRGAGEELGPMLRLPPLYAALVNPRVALETPRVFRALHLEPGDNAARRPHPELLDGSSMQAVLAALREGRNDLEPAAGALAPAIGEVLRALKDTDGCRLARMSGSGATVFGLYDDRAAAEAAAKALCRLRPLWWIKATVLR